jgi:putative SOS response-associated peptidase YedK
MCGRYTLRTPLSVLARQFEFGLSAPLPDFGPLFNIAPTTDVAAVRTSESGTRELAFLHWGLIPSWAKDSKLAYSTINARADSVATKPAFRAAFKKRRCLVLSDGYYEWLRQGKTKLPYLYEVDGGQPFALAGVWESWRGPEGGAGPPLESCSLITTEANALAGEIHDRMPVILDQADYDRWLNPQIHDPVELQPLLAPFPAERMTARPVSTFVNNVRNQGPKCVEPVGQP